MINGNLPLQFSDIARTRVWALSILSNKRTKIFFLLVGGGGYGFLERGKLFFLCKTIENYLVFQRMGKIRLNCVVTSDIFITTGRLQFSATLVRIGYPNSKLGFNLNNYFHKIIFDQIIILIIYGCE